MAVGQGFDPREDLSSTVFKTAAFDHSASPPENFDFSACSEVRGRRDYTVQLRGHKGPGAPLVTLLQGSGLACRLGHFCLGQGASGVVAGPGCDPAAGYH